MATEAIIEGKPKNIFAEVASSAFIYSLAIFFPRIASLALLPLYTRYLLPAQYGVVDLLDMTMSFCSIFLAVPMAQPMFYFYSRELEPGARRSIVSTAVFGSALMGLLVTLLVGITAPWLSQAVFQTREYSPLLMMTGLTLGANIPFDTALGWFRIANEPQKMAAWAIVKTVLQIALAAGALIVFRGELFPLVAAGAIACTSLSVALLFYCGKSNGFRLDRKLFGTQWRMALPSIITAASQYFVNFSSRFFLQRIADLAAVGLYALGYKFGGTVGLVQSSVHSYWSAQAHFLFQHPDRDRLINRIFISFFALMATFVVALSLLARPLIRLIAAPAYSEAWQYVPILAGGFLFKAVIDFLRASLFTQARFKTDAGINVMGAVFSGVIMAFLVPNFGARGAAASFVLSQAFILALIAWQLWGTAEVHISLTGAAWMSLLLAAAISPPYLFDPHAVLPDLVMALVAFGAFVAASLLTIQPLRSGIGTMRRMLLDRLA